MSSNLCRYVLVIKFLCQRFILQIEFHKPRKVTRAVSEVHLQARQRFTRSTSSWSQLLEVFFTTFSRSMPSFLLGCFLLCQFDSSFHYYQFSVYISYVICWSLVSSSSQAKVQRFNRSGSSWFRFDNHNDKYINFIILKL